MSESEFKNYKIYDLTRVLSRDMPTLWMNLSWYRPPIMAQTTDFSGMYIEPDRKGFYETIHIIHSHTGTHMDAPAHYYNDQDHWAMHNIPIDRLIGEGVILGIPKGEKQEITLEDLKKAKQEIHDEDIVVFNTGWHKKFCGPITDWEKAKHYASNWPGIHEEVAEYLVDKKVKWVGIDHLCLDPYRHSEAGDNTWLVHQILLKHNIPIVEDVVGDIDKITDKRSVIMALPHPVFRADGFLCRALALLKEQ